jgi:hypothetical protein
MSKEFNKNRFKKEQEFIYFIPAKDLNKISPDKGNRVDSDDSNHVNSLVSSMEREGYLKRFPITLSGKGVIKDGHHRYRAAKKANIGVWVKIDINDDFDLVSISQADGLFRHWKSLDWIKKFAKEGIGEFPEILNFYNKYDFGVKIVQMLLLNAASEASNKAFDNIRYGEFEVPKENWEIAHQNAQKILDFSDYFENPRDARTIQFSCAVLKLLTVDGYDHDKMLKAISRNQTKFVLQGRRKENMSMMIRMYNKGKPAKFRIAMP